MTITYDLLRADDYERAMALWNQVEGVRANESRDEFARFLARNPSHSFAARSDTGQLVGAVLCGHDGRRGYLYHLAVANEWSRNGIGSELIRLCLAGLREARIDRCTIFLIRDNQVGRSFWTKNGWRYRDDLDAFAFDLAPHP